MAVTSQPSLIRDLLALSRFDRYNPLFTTFAGGRSFILEYGAKLMLMKPIVWSALLAGATVLADENSTASVGFVFRQTGLCCLAAYIFCGAGMVWNDWIDRDIDAHVARTKSRPLAARRVTTTQAMVWMTMQVVASYLVLRVMLNGKDVLKHLLPVMAASILYPFGKRPTALKLHLYPQYILGFTIAWPAIPGWAAIHGQHQSFTETTYQCLPLCVMTYFWTLYLNTAYSYQDVVDDRKLNVNSFYNVAGRHIHLLLVVLASPVVVCLPLFLSQFNSVWLWVAWMGFWTVSFAEQLVRFDAKRPATGGTVHKSNVKLGLWTIVACAVEVFLKCRPTHLA